MGAVPAGVGNSITNVLTESRATRTFTMPEGFAILTFQPYDVDDPGVATLYDSVDVEILTMKAGGYETLQIPTGGKSYYWTATKGAKLLAMTIPSSLR